MGSVLGFGVYGLRPRLRVGDLGFRIGFMMSYMSFGFSGLAVCFFFANLSVERTQLDDGLFWRESCNTPPLHGLSDQGLRIGKHVRFMRKEALAANLLKQERER